MSLTKLSLAETNLIIPGQGEFGKCHPGWGRETANLFFTVYQRKRNNRTCRLGISVQMSEAQFLDVIGTKVLRVFLLAIHSHLYYRIVLPPSLEQTLNRSKTYFLS